jgi:MFS superfamily sulfate permease-like transporter
VRSYPQAEHLPGLVIYRLDGPLFFANAKTFRDELRKLAQADPPPTWILIAAEPVTDVDTTASDVLEELDEALNDQASAWCSPSSRTAPLRRTVSGRAADPLQRRITPGRVSTRRARPDQDRAHATE